MWRRLNWGSAAAFVALVLTIVEARSLPGEHQLTLEPGWTAWRGNSMRNGWSASAAPRHLALGWSFLGSSEEESWAWPSPVVFSEGDILTMRGSEVTRLDSDGDQMWTRTIPYTRSPVGSGDGTVFLVSQAPQPLARPMVYAISKEGTILWKRLGRGLTASLGASEDRVYCASLARLEAFSPTGRRLWQVAGRHSAPVVSPRGDVYTLTGQDASRLVAYNKNGHLLWEREERITPSANPAIGRDGTIYLVLGGRLIRAISPEGVLKWQRHVAVNGALAVGPGGIFFSSGRDAFRAYATSGNERWVRRLGFAGGSPSIDSRGAVLIPGRSRFVVVALDAREDGRKLWQWGRGGFLAGNPLEVAIGPRGLYLYGTGDRLFALQDDPSTPRSDALRLRGER